MKTTFRKSMIWLHTYVGLVTGWLLFVIFLTGTLSYYNHEITHWMTGKSLTNNAQVKLINHGLVTLSEKAPNATSWRISLPDERGAKYYLTYREEGKRHNIFLDANELTEPEKDITLGGNFFRTFHYTLSMGQWGGRYITGIAAMAMLIAVFTGIYTHRRFFKDFFTLRRKNKDKFTADFHALSGIVTIPFCFVICFSALAIYINMYQPFTIHHYFDNYRSLDRAVSTRHESLPAKSEFSDPVTDIRDFIPALKQSWGENMFISSLSVSNPADANAQFTFIKSKQDLLSNKALSKAFNRVAKPMEDIDPERAARMVRRVFYGMHEAHFAGPILRAMLFGLGMLSTLLIATGMVIWVNKRQLKKNKKVYAIIQKTNYGIFYGLSLATACYFLCSKLPAQTKSLAAYELSVFFYSWLITLILCYLTPIKLGLRILLIANAMSYLCILFLEILFTDFQQIMFSEIVDVPYITVLVIVFSIACYFVNACLKQTQLSNFIVAKKMSPQP